MEEKHGACKKVRCEFCEGLKDPWWRAMCGVLLKDRKRFTTLMFMLGLNETMDQLAISNSVRW